MAHENFNPMFEMLKTIATGANEVSAKIKSASASDSEALETVLNTSTDPAIIKWRESHAKGVEQIAAAQSKLDERKAAVSEHAKSLLPNADFDVEAEKKVYLQKRAEATALRKALLTMLGGDEKALAEKIEEFGITEVIGIRGNSKTVGATGIRRPRISEGYVGDKRVQDSAGKVSFTSLAKEIGADVNALKDAAFTAAGTKDLSEKAGETLTFPFTVKDKTEQITVVVKSKDVSEDKADDDEADEATASE